MSDAEFELELVEALNMLLEDERASVEMEVALASGATEYSEREALAAMGAEDIHFCEQLREEMERAGLAVTPQINGIVFSVIGAERYDDRLRAFAHHQRAVADRARELQESNLEGAFREAFEGISASHDHDVQWSEQRASEFAATRLLEFGPARGASTPESVPVAGDPVAPPELVIAQELEVEAPVELDSNHASETDHAERPQPVEVSVVEETLAAAPESIGSAESFEGAQRDETQDVAGATAKPRASRARAPRAASATKASATKASAKPKTSRARSASSAEGAPARRTRRTSAAEPTGDA
ncbi:MAG TPA: hypothetical protein VFN78_11885 [Ktedonobacterales bacterium]|nr:hypothetical protein [Ktedonobacterales bacterium]